MIPRVIPIRSTEPVILSIEMPDGILQVFEVEDGQQAEVILKTGDDEGPCVQAVQDATVIQTLDSIAVHVPPVAQGNGRRSYDGPGVHITAKYIGRVDVTAEQVSVSGPQSFVHAIVRIPARSKIAIRSRSADVVVGGEMASVHYTSTSGHLSADHVGRLIAVTHSSDVIATAVTKELSVVSVSGDVEIDEYSGENAEITTVSGDVMLHAVPSSSGRLKVNTVSGAIRLNGTQHLDTDYRTVSGHVRVQ